MSALAKYYEDNLRIAEERLRDKAESDLITPKVKRSKKQAILEKRKMKENPFTPKKGYVRYLKNRNELIIVIRQFMFQEWINFLKENGWRWNKYQKCWVAKYSSDNENFAHQFIAGINFDVIF